MLLILLMSKGSKEALTVLIVIYVTHVKRVKSGVCGLCTQYRYIKYYVKRVTRLCYVETRDKHIFAHNFLNIQPIFDPQKVLKSWDLDLFNHTFQWYVCQRGRKLFWLSTPLTCFNIHSIGWLERSKSQLSKTFCVSKIGWTLRKLWAKMCLSLVST